MDSNILNNMCMVKGFLITASAQFLFFNWQNLIYLITYKFLYLSSVLLWSRYVTYIMFACYYNKIHSFVAEELNELGLVIEDRGQGTVKIAKSVHNYIDKPKEFSMLVIFRPEHPSQPSNSCFLPSVGVQNLICM